MKNDSTLIQVPQYNNSSPTSQNSSVSQKPDSLPINQICISEPDAESNDIKSNKSPTDEVLIKTPSDDRQRMSQLTPTINEDTEYNNEQNKKSSLSLPVEPPPMGPIERDRRKLSVQGK